MKTRIIYGTKTNHSKKLADALGAALNIKVENISEQPILNHVDLLFIVGGIYGGESLPELLEFAKDLTSQNVKSLALVTNCLSGRHQQKSLRRILEENGIAVIDEFICRGALLFLKLGHPNSKELNDAVKFANHIVNTC